MWEDPIVKETRRIRIEIEKEYESDFKKLGEAAKQIQNKYRDRLVENLKTRKTNKKIPA